jgi:mRNA-degrading endonuclease RelE of RelBE toxin-antitoxin system
MKSFTTKRFRDGYRSLPDEVRKQAREAYRKFMDDPNHPGLHFKKVIASKSIYSARVGLHYRVLGIRDDEEIIWFWIGTHTEYDKLLKNM